MPFTKSFLIKVYDQDGTTLLANLQTEPPVDGSMYVKSDIEFSSRINGGLSELVLDIAAPFDDFDEGGTVDFMNVVDVYAVTRNLDTLTQTSRRIYSGFCSRYEPYIEVTGNQGVRMTLLGFYSLMSTSYYGSAPSYAVTHTAEDPEAIAQAIIDNVNSAYSGSLYSYAGTTDTVGTNVTYTFTEQHWHEALTKTTQLAGIGWWHSIDRDRKLNFRDKPSTPTHAFTIDKDIDSLVCPKDSEKVVNEVIVKRSGGTTSSYSDATSQAEYGTGSPATGRRTVIISDSSITNLVTADQRGDKALGDGKDAKIRATIVVNQEYDLESIQVGDTVKILNFDGSSAFFGSNNMQIVELTYRPEAVTIQLEQMAVNFGQTLTSLVASTPTTTTGGGGGGGGSSVTHGRDTYTGDGVTTVFTLSHTPNANSDIITSGGAVQKGGGEDYTISGTSLTFVTPPVSGAIIQAIYTY